MCLPSFAYSAIFLVMYHIRRMYNHYQEDYPLSVRNSSDFGYFVLSLSAALTEEISIRLFWFASSHFDCDDCYYVTTDTR